MYKIHLHLQILDMGVSG